MSIPFKTSIDLEKNELLNARIQNLSSDPTTGLVKGLIYFNTTSNVFRCYNGTKFEDFEPSFTKNTAFNKAFGNAEGTVCQGNDARLSDSRTPTAHAASHISTGADAIAAAVSDGASGLMTGSDKKKLDGIAENANNYSHPTSSGNKHIPSGGNAGNFLAWSADGTASWANISGVLPLGGEANQILKYDGTSEKAVWSTMDDTIHGQRGGTNLHSAATDQAAGFMSSTDKKKLDDATDAATASKLVIRDSSGKAKVVTPLATDDATTIATKGYVDNSLNVNDVLQFISVIDCSKSGANHPNYPAADAGHVYVVSVAGKIGGNNGPSVEAGDKLMCLVDNSVAGDHSMVGANWNITQVNIDGAVTGPPSVTGGNLVEFDGESGKLIKDSGKKISSYAPLSNPFFYGDTLVSQVNIGKTGSYSSMLTQLQLASAEGSWQLRLASAIPGDFLLSKTVPGGDTYTAAIFSAWADTVGGDEKFYTKLELVDEGRLYAKEIYLSQTRKDTNWDSAYTHSSATGNPHGTTKANLGIYSGASDVGNGTDKTFTITHNQNTKDIVVLVRSNSSPYEQVFTDIEFDNVNSFKVKFAIAPASSAYRVIWHKV